MGRLRAVSLTTLPPSLPPRSAMGFRRTRLGHGPKSGVRVAALVPGGGTQAQWSGRDLQAPVLVQCWGGDDVSVDVRDLGDPAPVPLSSSCLIFQNHHTRDVLAAVSSVTCVPSLPCTVLSTLTRTGSLQ